MVVKAAEGSSYARFVAKVDLSKGVVYEEWSKIWNTDLIDYAQQILKCTARKHKI